MAHGVDKEPTVLWSLLCCVLVTRSLQYCPCIPVTSTDICRDGRHGNLMKPSTINRSTRKMSRTELGHVYLMSLSDAFCCMINVWQHNQGLRIKGLKWALHSAYLPTSKEPTTTLLQAAHALSWGMRGFLVLYQTIRFGFLERNLISLSDLLRPWWWGHPNIPHLG